MNESNRGALQVASRFLTKVGEELGARARGGPLWTFGSPLPPIPTSDSPAAPDWVAANPGWIERALQRALARPSGGWYVVGASRQLVDTPRKYRIDGTDYVVWRDGPALRAAPDTCPHLGASLSRGVVREGRVVCPWHGLALGDAPHGSWRCIGAHDDGVLLWLAPERSRSAPADSMPSPIADLRSAPILSERPKVSLSGVIQMEAACEPEDVLANRLDPWHGVHFHPYSFARLRVVRREEDAITVRVAYRVAGPVCVEVDATFFSPQPRAIVMRIDAGEGEGSVVETHATPIEPGRCAIIEATMATSRRTGFRYALGARALLRPLIERAARRLWVDDAEYAERRYLLRQRSR